MWRYLLPFVVMMVLGGCGSPEINRKDAGQKRFYKFRPGETGIDFSNDLTVQDDFDVFRYHNFYNGGGVAIADINNDGLSDVYLTSNMGDNKLFLNKGNWKFEDITEKAGVKGTKMWSTGVSVADINSDGLLDIYVCNAGSSDSRENELFINNGDLTFTEQAKQYGLADKGFSTHAAFFDFDKDGDLDCYLLNNSDRPVSSLGYRNLRHVRDEYGGHKLFRNDKGKYTDISEKAGIFGSIIGFGLGVAVGDVNQDNWPDLYVSNDFYERDYLYINNQDGTFKEKLEEYMGHISMFSMGADVGDLNNDGFPEIFSTDMLPADDYRFKTLTAFETFDVYQLRLKNDYYHQFMRNMLHLNNQDGTFSEIGQMAGVYATDWSWGALIADFNNDMFKEIYVCNGIYKDVTNQDFVEFLSSSDQVQAALQGKKIDFKSFVEKMPSVKLSNYMFERRPDGSYQNVSERWGLDEPSFSNGAAYGDLDNDGDLDIVVNNVNQDVFVYKNQSREQNNGNYLSVTCKGYGENHFGIGARLKAFVAGQIVAVDHMPMRGFQSSMDYKMVIGLGTNETIDSLVVTWPDDKVSHLHAVKTNQHVIVDHKDAGVFKATEKKINQLLIEDESTPIAHQENEFNDFDRDRLLYHLLSTQGPAFAYADLNNDGDDDFYLGGSIGNLGKLYITKARKLSEVSAEAFSTPLTADEVDAAFFDADGDNDLDLYVVTGGSEHLAQSKALQDRFYKNNGTKNGVPEFEEHKLPDLYESGSCVRPADVDQDGDLDLFVGSRGIPAFYGLPADQYLLINDGSGNFSEAPISMASALQKLGMVTDATWFNYDGDNFPDLLIVGEWMPLTILANNGKQLKIIENIEGLSYSSGLWNKMKPADLDGDGDTDFVIGNLGLNSKFKTSKSSPLSLYVGDFDQNGAVEPLFAFIKDGQEYPMALRQDIIKQMSSLKKQFVYYKDYAGKSMTELFNTRQLERSQVLKLYELRSCVLMNEGQKFTLKSLPSEAQVSPVYGIAIKDLNKDKIDDLVLGGNLFGVKPEVGRYDALHGLVLTGDKRGNFRPLNSLQSGLKLVGEVRHIAVLKRNGSEQLAFIMNNDTIKVYTVLK